MFISKQFRNFVHSKSLKSVFCNCFFEITHANSIQSSFSILKILPKKCVAHLYLNLLHSYMNTKDFSFKCRQIVDCVTIALAGKLFVTEICKVCNYVFRSNFFSAKCVSLKLLLDVAVIFSKLLEVQMFSRIQSLFHIRATLTRTIRHIQTALRLSLVVNFKILC